MDINIVYSTNIEKFARLRGKTMKDLLDEIDLPASSYYSMKEKNQFTTKTLERFAQALDVKVSDLVKSTDVSDKKEMLDDFEKIKDKLQDFEDKHLK